MKVAVHERSLLWFQLLTPAEQRVLVCKLADQGRSDQIIASLTKLDVGAIRKILSDRCLTINQEMTTCTNR